MRLHVNHAKWKRWSREFLPPDPLGGLQSGFARQYSLKDAFLVALGGLLVGELKFGVPEARIILKDLSPWLTRAGYLRLKPNSNGGTKSNTYNAPRNHHDMVFVRPRSEGNSDYIYWIQCFGKDSELKSFSGGLGCDLKAGEFFSIPGVRVMNIGGFSAHFYNCLLN